MALTETPRRPTAAERIVSAMLRHGISYADVIQRVATDEELPAWRAVELVNRLEVGIGCPIVVAVAIISIIVDKNDAGKLQ